MNIVSDLIHKGVARESERVTRMVSTLDTGLWAKVPVPVPTDTDQDGTKNSSVDSLTTQIIALANTR